VDGVGRVMAVRPEGDCHWLEVETPAALAPYIIHKGAIAIDGISLTVASLTAATVGVQIVPFTFAETTLREIRAGDAVNLEADVIGKYVARLLGDRIAAGERTQP
jgi:riboflavin synthase